jgi:hypothetical protein
MQGRCGFVISALLALGCVGGLCQSQPPNGVPVLRDGTPVHLAMGRTVSSGSDQPGEVVEFVVKEDLTVGDTIVLPEGSSVYGKVTAARCDDRSGTGGMVEFQLESLKLSNGQDVPLRNIKQLPTGANAEISPEKLANLVNSPYAPFAHFNMGNETTVPKNSLLTLYVAADVAISNQVVVAKPPAGSQVDSLAAHIIDKNTGAKSLGDIAREQRERGKISGGMVSSPQ